MFKLICVTNRRLCREDFSLRLAKIAAAGPDAIILREKDLPAAAYRRLAEQALSICGQYEAPCVLHGFAQQALGLGAPRLHLPLPQLARLDEAERRRFACLGASCHSLADLQAARRLGCHYIIAGHIFATDCKPGRPGRGLAFLREICRAALELTVKKCAKSIADKYIKPPYTTDFAIMFLPCEGLYAEVVNLLSLIHI